jgi:RNA polymerase sigma-70 factor (ECF subfamily)
MVEQRPLPDALLEQARAVSRLDRLLARLPLPLKRVLVLAEMEQASAAEIAALEQIPLGTAASRLRRARAAFRELLVTEAACLSEKEPG